MLLTGEHQARRNPEPMSATAGTRVVTSLPSSSRSSCAAGRGTSDHLHGDRRRGGCVDTVCIPALGTRGWGDFVGCSLSVDGAVP